MTTAEHPTEHVIVPDGPAMTKEALARVRQWLTDAIVAKGRAVMALAGGKTPEHFYRELGNVDLPWENVLLLLGDERFVPQDDPRSNAAMVRNSLMAGGKACTARFLAPEIEGMDYQEAAHAYEAAISRALGIATGGQLTLDVVILGIGLDGHTASLFPDSPALIAQKAWVFAVPAGDVEPKVPRLTMTLPVLNRAKHVMFLAGGQKKMEVAKEVWEKGVATGYPAAKMCPQGKCVWIVAEQL